VISFIIVSNVFLNIFRMSASYFFSMYICICIYIYMYNTYICVYVYKYMYINIYICIYLSAVLFATGSGWVSSAPFGAALRS
jgi:hypothetical protein